MEFSICWVICHNDNLYSTHHKNKPNTNYSPIIHQYHSPIQMTEPSKKVTVEKEICTRLDGCPIVNNACLDCEIVKR